MELKEAIKIVDRIRDEDGYTEDAFNALTLAINTLKACDTILESIPMNMSLRNEFEAVVWDVKSDGGYLRRYKLKSKGETE